GLAVVVLILAINAGIIAFVIKNQSKGSQSAQGQVTVNQDALSKLGVNRTVVGDSGIQLTVNPDAKFDGNLQVAGDTSIAGQLKLNSKFVAADASLTQLEAGKTSLSQLNVNGDGTLSNLNLRSDLIVAGSTRLQGATFGQLVTVNNSLNVSGNLAVGGALAIANFSTGNITVTGHVITSGSSTSVAGGACGSATNSGNDATGTIFIPIGSSGCSGGTIASLVFRGAYGSTPQVIITPVHISGGSTIPSGVTFYVTNVSTSGFSVGMTGSVGAGGLSINYIVEQ
ncbi:MAG TPA: hypothetical protein VG964_02310, partial [Candidatus Saccharimonadales bacterium]|nr:hypothetical protein [Candidatus Saccharimonadales bacterium]